jgi:hypothetical protein
MAPKKKTTKTQQQATEGDPPAQDAQQQGTAAQSSSAPVATNPAPMGHYTLQPSMQWLTLPVTRPMVERYLNYLQAFEADLVEWRSRRDASIAPPCKKMLTAVAVKIRSETGLLGTGAASAINNANVPTFDWQSMEPIQFRQFLLGRVASHDVALAYEKATAAMRFREWVSLDDPDSMDGEAWITRILAAWPELQLEMLAAGETDQVSVEKAVVARLLKNLERDDRQRPSPTRYIHAIMKMKATNGPGTVDAFVEDLMGTLGEVYATLRRAREMGWGPIVGSKGHDTSQEPPHKKAKTNQERTTDAGAGTQQLPVAATPFRCYGCGSVRHAIRTCLLRGHPNANREKKPWEGSTAARAWANAGGGDALVEDKKIAGGALVPMSAEEIEAVRRTSRTLSEEAKLKGEQLLALLWGTRRLKSVFPAFLQAQGHREEPVAVFADTGANDGNYVSRRFVEELRAKGFPMQEEKLVDSVRVNTPIANASIDSCFVCNLNLSFFNEKDERRENFPLRCTVLETEDFQLAVGIDLINRYQLIA